MHPPYIAATSFYPLHSESNAGWVESPTIPVGMDPQYDKGEDNVADIWPSLTNPILEKSGQQAVIV